MDGGEDLRSEETASGTAINLRTCVVDGALAFHMRRYEAARRSETGLQILTLPQLAARLAGGFVRPATRDDIEPAIRSALDTLELSDLSGFKTLPGMINALTHSMQRLWNVDVRLSEGNPSARLSDLARIDRHLRTRLGAAVRVPPDLVAAALERVELAPQLLGPVTIEYPSWIAPVWRPLLAALRALVPVTEINLGARNEGLAEPNVFICSDPRSEAVEALRWARALIAGGVAPGDIAIAATAPGAWDEAMQAMARAADLPLHSAHGVPVLATVEGQACAALAELLAHGLSQERVSRLLGHSANRCEAFATLPHRPLAGIHAAAYLGSTAQWEAALRLAEPDRADKERPRLALLPMLELIAQGWVRAEEAGRQLLPRGARRIWEAALRAASADAVPFTLERLRSPDSSDPATCVAWCTAGQLASAPRPFVRLIGLSANAWPRPLRTDPILPDHILTLSEGLERSRPDADRQAFAAISTGASQELALSFARRSSRGGLQVASPLIDRQIPRTRLARHHVPAHAFSQSDRLAARLDEAATQPRFVQAQHCWTAWRAPDLSGHDGRIRAEHPAIVRLLAEAQSPTSLQRLLRDPLGFVWRYGLGWRSSISQPPPLDLDPRAFGELVHDLLQRTVIALEPSPGFGQASSAEREHALAGATEAVTNDWPVIRAVPPRLLWRYTVEAAHQIALKALQLDQTFSPETRSWTEVRFGEANDPAPTTDLPWDPRDAVPLSGTRFHIKGSIDRLEYDARRARLTDYKTAKPPAIAELLAGGAQLQRILYTAAVRHHRQDAQIAARLVYLGGDTPKRHLLKDQDLDGAIETAVLHLNAAAELLLQGNCLPGPEDPWRTWNPLRIALPSTGEPYAARKQQALRSAFGDFAQVWNAQ